MSRFRNKMSSIGLPACLAVCAALLAGCFGTGGDSDSPATARLQPHQGYQCPTALKDVQTHPGGAVRGCEITFSARTPAGWTLTSPTITSFPPGLDGTIVLSEPTISNSDRVPATGLPTPQPRPGELVIQISDQVPLTGSDLGRTHLRFLQVADFKPLQADEPHQLIARIPLFLAGRRFSIRASSGRAEPSHALVDQANNILQSLSVGEKLCPCRS